MDAAGGYVAGDAQVADVGFVAHALEFADGDVVALVVVGSGEGEVGYCGEDDDSGRDNFDWAFPGFVWHMSSAFDFQFTSVQVYVQSKPGGPPLCLLLRKVFKTLDLMVDLTIERFRQKSLSLCIPWERSASMPVLTTWFVKSPLLLF
jgi:hypothetical protein